MGKEQDTQVGSPKYWLSLEQWRNDPEFAKLAENEFRDSPLSSEDGKDGVARREFLKLMGASLALTSFGCVRRPAQKIVPYANRPEEVVPGIANYYSSHYMDGSESFGLVVKTREGRPIKVDGNPDYPLSKGATSARAVAHILSLYDPDRLTEPKENLLNPKRTNRDVVSLSFEDLDTRVITALKKGKAALLTESVVSPTTRSLISDFKKNHSIKHYQWDGLNQGIEGKGFVKSFGKRVTPRYLVDKADLIVAIGADFLGTYLTPTEFTKQFSSRRNPDGNMNQLVVFESLLSLTGSNADQRFIVPSRSYVDVVMGLAYSIVAKMKKSSFAGNSSILQELEPYKDAAHRLGIDPESFDGLAKSLWENSGKSLVLAGGISVQDENAESLQVATNFLNYLLGNFGKSIDVSRAPLNSLEGSYEDLKELAEQIESGQIETVIVSQVNPIYQMPENSKFQKAIRKAKLVVYIGDRVNETAQIAHLVIPSHHPMEEWSDAEVRQGLFAIQQPTIRPLYKSRSLQECLIKWAGGLNGKDKWYDYLRSYWKSAIFPKVKASSFDDFWYELLQTGFVETNGDLSARSDITFKSSALSQVKSSFKSDNSICLQLYSTIGLRDGSLANVPWLQEFPDPVTKICWDNYICVSPSLAGEHHLKEGQIVEVSLGENKLSAPIHIQPGQHNATIGLAVGYGRTAAGKIADGVGVNAFNLVVETNDGFVFSGQVAKIKKSSQFIELATVQEHHRMEGRQIVVEAALQSYKKNNEAGIHRHKIFSMWGGHEYKGHKWAMAIDLSKCTGCSACMTACRSENNIPVVGKKYMLQGREMDWIRIDRYYSGNPDEPRVVFQPVMCAHCDNAPCETVCPVAATTHNSEGLNEMTYNRCVGTRYCANNCPYKVRRFNWFDYTNLRDPLPMALNPEVTVRDRGVMEKCTFCDHKIRQVKEHAKQKGIEVKDGDIKTACQTACPADAIIFGDVNDPESAVAKSYKQKRQYSLLEEVNAQPNVRYLAKIRNIDHMQAEDNGHGGGHH